MEYQIAMLLKPHMCDFCHSLIGKKYRDCVLTYYPYETLDEMADIFDEIKAGFDGAITSGLIPHSLIVSMIEDGEISAGCFGFDVENTYRIILEQSVCRENFSLSRIGVDFVPEGQDVAQVIAQNQMPRLVEEFEKWLRSLPMENLNMEEQGIAERYLARFDRGEIDFIVTYFYSTVLEMRKHGIDCFYLYPNEREIEHTFYDMEKSIMLRRASLPGVIRIELRPGRDDLSSMLERKIMDLEQNIQRMLSDQGEGLVLNRRNYAVEFYTDSQVMKRLTGGYRQCFFRRSLMEKVGFTGTIGYGMAADFYHARSNAMDAGNYASNFREPEMRSVLMGEDEKMNHLGVNESVMVSENTSPEWVLHVAQAARLSPETILKIIEVLRAEGTQEISSTDLIGRLGVSLRTANRFLSHLQQADLAQVVAYRPAVGRGRPIAVYKLSLINENDRPEKKAISATIWPR